jgi:hypothetical protein
MIREGKKGAHRDRQALDQITTEFETARGRYEENQRETETRRYHAGNDRVVVVVLGES